MKRHVAVVGAGYWGRNLVRVFDRLGALHAVCDTEEDRLERLETDAAVRRCTRVEQVLDDSAVRSVVIATPAATHYELCRQALSAGRDVMVEKPLALTVEQGKELVELAERSERILMVGHILRYHPAVIRLAGMITDGELGRVEYIYSNRLNLGKLRSEENILWSFAPHDISVILALLTERPLLVSSHGEAFLQKNVSDVTLTAIEFANGVKAHTFVSWLHPFKEQRLVVVGSEQMAVFEDSRPDEKLVIYPHRVQWHAGKIPVAVKGERRVVEIPDAEPLKVECEHFLESCVTRIPPRTDGEEGLAVLEVLAAAEASLRRAGEPVALAAPGNGRCRQAVGANARAGATELVTASAQAGLVGAGPMTDHQSPMTNQTTRPRARVANPESRSRLGHGAEAPREPRSGQPPTSAGRMTNGSPGCFVHPTAVVDPGAEVGDGTRVWHFAHVSAGARIGAGNVLGQNVFVAEGVVTGRNCKVQNNVSLYKGVVLEDDVFCGPSCVFTNVIDPRAFVEKKSEFRPTVVRQGASIGANATVVCGNTLGRYCLVGSGAVVTREVPDYALVVGVPARQLGWVCRCGERLRFADWKTDSPQRPQQPTANGLPPTAGDPGARRPESEAVSRQPIAVSHLLATTCVKCGERYELADGKVTARQGDEGTKGQRDKGIKGRAGSLDPFVPRSLDRSPVPMLDLRREYRHMKQDIDRSIETALAHQAWIMGPEVKELEKRVAGYIGTKFAVGCASGTDALVLALRALALKRTGSEYFTREDEVITTPFTFTATGDAILRAGATPVFVDIEPGSFNIDPDRVRAAVNERTVGIMPVHLYGQICRMEELCSIAREKGLFVVEDCAQSFGADVTGRKCGSLGDCGAFSFFPSKNLGGFGDGGMVTTDDRELAEMCDFLRKHGGKDKYNVERLGYNSRLDTLQAAVLLAKLGYLDGFNDRRKRVAARYTLALTGAPGIVAPALPRNGEHVFHQYTLRCSDRDRLAARLKELGIESMVYYKVPLHKMKVFDGRSRCAGSLAEAERAAAEVLSLPIEPLLTSEEIEAVIAAVKEAAQS